MVGEPLQNYVNLVNGLSRATRAKALAAARALLAQAGLEDAANEAGEKVAKLTEEVLNASRANRELLENLITAEVEKTTARLGLVRTEDLEIVSREIARLQRDVIELRAALALASEPPAPTVTGAAKKTPAKRAPATRAPAKRPARQPAAPADAAVPPAPVPAPPTGDDQPVSEA
ncbi:MAG: hypothetical protein JWP61_1054 [Friedmanniella sp.]|nr:hypothetical protein [Friedmanniella sp.]